jgi:hypothetical protein
VLGGSLLALAGCNGTALPDLDWDLRAGPGNTSEEARQATAAKPVPDANGVLSYPGYQLAQARRGDTIASMAARLGLNPDELARTNALKPNDPLRAGELLLLPSRVSAVPQPVGGGARPHRAAGRSTSPRSPPPRWTRPAAAPPPNPPPPPPAAARSRCATRSPAARPPSPSRGPTTSRPRRWRNGTGLARHGGARGPDADHPGRHRTRAEPRTRTHRPGAGSPTPEPPSAKEPLPDEKTTPAAEKPKETPPSPDLGGSSQGEVRHAGAGQDHPPL